MGVRIAYGQRADIATAIKNGIIPTDSIIIIKNNDSTAELMFYDSATNLKHIVAKTHFLSEEEALQYAAEVAVDGQIITALNAGKYCAYIVQPDKTLSPITGGETDIPSDLISRLEALESISHQHPNKEALDSITPERMRRWDNGGVVSSKAENGVTVNPDGTMIVNAVNVRKLVQSESDTMILRCKPFTN